MVAGDSIDLFLPYFFIACKNWRDQHNWGKDISFENVCFFPGTWNTVGSVGRE